MRGLRLHEARRSRILRKDAPSAEAKLWAKLRARRLGGFKFVRQEPVGPYFADFACREERLAVEVDGATHSADMERAYDERRDAFFVEQGYRIMRIQNAEVFGDIAAVLETILAALERRTTW